MVRRYPRMTSPVDLTTEQIVDLTTDLIVDLIPWTRIWT